MEILEKSPVQFTGGAIEEIKRLMTEPGYNNDNYLRIGVKGGGCSGMSYILGFDSKNEKDSLYEWEGISFIIEPAHEIYLVGMEIDYQKGLNSRGFTFSNPNASSTCGCGTSFAV